MLAIDGRIFSTEAHSRGMGNYVKHLLETVAEFADEVLVITYDGFKPLDLSRQTLDKLRFEKVLANPNEPSKTFENIHQFTFDLENLLVKEKVSCYIDATPFVAPVRLDITDIPVVAVLYDLIPLRYPKSYLRDPFSRNVYVNALRRIKTADVVVAISKYVQQQCVHYLGRQVSDTAIFYPKPSHEYFNDHAGLAKRDAASSSLFGILGGHKSKNPEDALRLLEAVANTGKVDVTINVPTKHQAGIIKAMMIEPPNAVKLCSDISDTKKLQLQQSADAIFHLSVEEGFGIPLVEALLLSKKIVLLRTPINIEVVSSFISLEDCTRVFWLEDSGQSVKEAEKIARFITASNGALNPLENSPIQEHWESAREWLQRCVTQAQASWKSRNKQKQIAVVGNAQIEGCGVSDYSLSIPKGFAGSITLYTSDIAAPKWASYSNANVKTHLAFRHGSRENVPTIFHVAASPSLGFGLSLLAERGRANDVAVIHDFRNLYGIMCLARDPSSKLDLGLFLRGEDREVARSVNDELEGLPGNINKVFAIEEGGYRYDWLINSPVTKVFHAPSLAVAADRSPLSRAALQSPAFRRVEMGVSDTALPNVFRVAQRARRRLHVDNRALLVGCFGSVVPGKYLREIAESICAAQRDLDRQKTGVAIHLLICGKIFDASVAASISSTFRANAAEPMLHWANPLQDSGFDSLMVASDLLLMCRDQTRVQMSHALIRALSLGRPVLTNNKSGFGELAGIEVFDESQATALSDSLILFACERERLTALGQKAREAYETSHDIRLMIKEFFK